MKTSLTDTVEPPPEIVPGFIQPTLQDIAETVKILSGALGEMPEGLSPWAPSIENAVEKAADCIATVCSPMMLVKPGKIVPVSKKEYNEAGL